MHDRLDPPALCCVQATVGHLNGSGRERRSPRSVRCAIQGLKRVSQQQRRDVCMLRDSLTDRGARLRHHCRRQRADRASSLAEHWLFRWERRRRLGCRRAVHGRQARGRRRCAAGHLSHHRRQRDIVHIILTPAEVNDIGPCGSELSGFCSKVWTPLRSCHGKMQGPAGGCFAGGKCSINWEVGCYRRA